MYLWKTIVSRVVSVSHGQWWDWPGGGACHQTIPHETRRETGRGVGVHCAQGHGGRERHDQI